MSFDECPPLDVLLDYRRGELSWIETDRIDKHLEGCAVCRAALRRMERRGDSSSTGRPASSPQSGGVDPSAGGDGFEGGFGEVGDRREKKAPSTVDEFVVALGASRLMTCAEARSFLEALPVERRPVDAKTAAIVFAAAGRLTPYQARAVFQGRGSGLVIGERVVLELLGKGGMGRVYRALNRRLDRIEAIKLISPKKLASPDARARFDREARAAARINHPHVVATYDAGEVDGASFLCMEYVDGVDLARTVKERGVLSVEQAVDCLRQAAAGLQAAHEAGIVHRDIKPHNLLLDRTGRVKILDLGLARLSDAAADDAGEGLTHSGQVMGTVDYMSPEQTIDVRRVTPASDVYSLGCTLHFLLVGRPPFTAESVGAKMLAHHHQAPPSLRIERPDVPFELDRLFQRMLAKSPDERPPSMDRLGAELKAVAKAADATAETLLPPPLPARSTPDDTGWTAFLAQLGGEGASRAGSDSRSRSPVGSKPAAKPAPAPTPFMRETPTSAPLATFAPPRAAPVAPVAPVVQPVSVGSPASGGSIGSIVVERRGGEGRVGKGKKAGPAAARERRGERPWLLIGAIGASVVLGIGVLAILIASRPGRGSVHLTLGEDVEAAEVVVVLSQPGREVRIDQASGFEAEVEEGAYHVRLLDREAKFLPITSRITVAADGVYPLKIRRAPPPGIPQDAVKFRGRYYHYERGPLSWEQARLACARKHGRLASVESPEENSLLARISRYERAWIGIRYDGSAWVSQRGGSARYSNWFSREPSEPSAERYVVLNWEGPGKWHGLGAHAVYEVEGYLCEWDAPAARGATAGLNEPQDETLDEPLEMQVATAAEAGKSEEPQGAPATNQLADARTTPGRKAGAGSAGSAVVGDEPSAVAAAVVAAATGAPRADPKRRTIGIVGGGVGFNPSPQGDAATAPVPVARPSDEQITEAKARIKQVLGSGLWSTTERHRKAALAVLLLERADAAGSAATAVERIAACDLAAELANVAREPALAWEARRLRRRAGAGPTAESELAWIARLSEARDAADAWFAGWILLRLAADVPEEFDERESKRGEAIVMALKRLAASPYGRTPQVARDLELWRGQAAGLKSLLEQAGTPAERRAARAWAAGLLLRDWGRALSSLAEGGDPSTAPHAAAQIPFDRRRGRTDAAVALAERLERDVPTAGSDDLRALLKSGARFWWETAALQSGAEPPPQVKNRLASNPPKPPPLALSIDFEGGSRYLAPVAAPSGLIAVDGSDFARFNGAGALRYPAVPTSAYVHEIGFTLRPRRGSFVLQYASDEDGNRIVFTWNSSANRFHWEHQHFRSGVYSWSGNGSCAADVPQRLVVYACESRHVAQLDGGDRRSSHPSGRDLEFQMRTEGDLSAVVHHCRFRAWSALDAAELRCELPSYDEPLVEPGPTARRLLARQRDLRDRPLIKEPVDFCVASTGSPMVAVRPGDHLRTSGPDRPNTTVRIRRPFWIGRFELSQLEWLRLATSNPSRFRGSPYLPVDGCSFQEIAEFCRRLNAVEKSAGRLPDGYVYRLPTEAEWERAALAPTDPRQPAVVSLMEPDGVWHAANAQGRLREIGGRGSNAWGLFDMQGNAAELVLDAWSEFTPASSLIDPFERPNDEHGRFVVRGGGYLNAWSDVSPAARDVQPARGSAGRGFRLALGPVP